MTEAVVEPVRKLSINDSLSGHSVASEIDRSERPSCPSVSSSSKAAGSSSQVWCKSCRKKYAKKLERRQNALDIDSEDPFDSVSTSGSVKYLPSQSSSSRHASASATDSGYHGSSYPRQRNSSVLGAPALLVACVPDDAHLASSMITGETARNNLSSRHRHCPKCSRLRAEIRRVEKEQKRMEQRGGSASTSGSNGVGNTRKSSVFSALRATLNRIFDPKTKSNNVRVTSNVSQKSSRPTSETESRISTPDVSSESATTVSYLGFTSADLSDLDCMSQVVRSGAIDSECLLYYAQTLSSSLYSPRGSMSSLGTTLSTATNSELLHSSCGHDPILDQLSPLPDGLHGSHRRPFWEARLDYDLLHRRNPRLMGKQMSVVSSLAYLGPAQSCPMKSRSLMSQICRTSKDILCSSWPPSGKRIFLPDTEDEFMQEEEMILEHVRVGKESVYEFNIPYKDIKLGECVKHGKTRKIYKGHWHGEVMVHLFDNLNHQERSKFWEEVSKLSMTRHENIALFMGACMDPPNFAVVTNVCKGVTLYDKLHVSWEKTHQSFKLHVMRQIAQAVGYLHARNKPIIVGRLNSKNIFLEPKVVLCLLDCSFQEEDDDKWGYHSIPNHLLWYAAPELLDSFPRDPPRLIQENLLTQATDVYAFGTIMYELHANRYPFSKSDHNSFIEDICFGKREEIRDLRCSETVKSLIRDCWAHDPLGRPEFSDICHKLMQRHAAHKRHSSSEPENLHRLNDSTPYGY